MSRKIDTRAIGLDTALGFMRWLTGAEHLHYGLWTGLEVTAGNLRAAQDAYTARLFSHLPDRPGLRILDIGGGAGETAARLGALGHRVEIVVPSPLLAERCRENAPGAIVHPCRFEDYTGAGGFDLCLFSESFQYIPLPLSLRRALDLLAPGGEILIGDCFRSEGFAKIPGQAMVGGGHPVTAFREACAGLPVAVIAEEDITAEVAPSVDLEQALFHVIGAALSRIDAELAQKRRILHRMIHAGLALAISRRRRDRLRQRLFAQTRTAAMFCANNRYLMVRLRPPA